MISSLSQPEQLVEVRRLLRSLARHRAGHPHREVVTCLIGTQSPKHHLQRLGMAQREDADPLAFAQSDLGQRHSIAQDPMAADLAVAHDFPYLAVARENKAVRQERTFEVLRAFS